MLFIIYFLVSFFVLAFPMDSFTAAAVLSDLDKELDLLPYESKFAKVFDLLTVMYGDDDDEKELLAGDDDKQELLAGGDDGKRLQEEIQEMFDEERQSRENEAVSYKDVLKNLASVVINPGAWVAKLKQYTPFSMSRNFHTVVKNRLFRSRQLNRLEWLGVLDKHPDIKSVINLRGRNSKNKLCMDEEALLEEKKIDLYYVPMCAKYLPPKRTIKRLVAIIKRGKPSFIVHCAAGADRTGLVTALYSLVESEEEGKDIDLARKEAMKHLDTSYGHNPFMFPAMRCFVSIWKGYKWLDEEYDPSRYPALCRPEVSK